MKRLLLFLGFLVLLISPPVRAADSHLVQLRILDDGKPQAGVKVLVNYPDAERTSGTTITLATDAAGFVGFDLTEEVFWVTVPALNPDVVGREFRVPKNAQRTVRWDVRPREWKREGQR
jgi:hypothetical protein